MHSNEIVTLRRLKINEVKLPYLIAVMLTLACVIQARAGDTNLTYSVALHSAVASDRASFAKSVASAYADPRGWSLSGRLHFREVQTGGDFTIWLVPADQMRSFSSSCSAQWSCRVGRDVVINEERWDHGSPYWQGPLSQYRIMLINHETGHWLGLDHLPCGGPGQLAPVMMQQSKGAEPCLINAWPLQSERRRVAEIFGLSL